VTELEPELFTSSLISAQGIEQGPQCCTVVPSARGEKYFQQSDTIFVTGCTLVTDTMDEILKLCAGKKIIVYGATAGFLPLPLLQRGVQSIHTLYIKNTDEMVDLLLNCAGTVEKFFSMASENMLLTKVI
jgi:uncharacterized protein (DUF4213/DUF364 family)